MSPRLRLPDDRAEHRGRAEGGAGDLDDRRRARRLDDARAMG